MDSMHGSFLMALKPTVTIKVSNLDNDSVPREIIKEIHQVLARKYRTFLDEPVGVIYVGKRI